MTVHLYPIFQLYDESLNYDEIVAKFYVYILRRPLFILFLLILF